MIINRVEDPTFFEENKLAPHSDHKTVFDGKYASRESLDGMWKFKFEKNIESVNEAFVSEDFDSSVWDDIKVPAHIQMEGYDKPHYVNTQYPWDGHEKIDPGQIPTQFNPVGCYVNHFLVESIDDSDTRILCFEGVESALALWINGKYAGYSEGSFLPAEFDISPYVHVGKNTIAAAVIKWSASSWAEDQDFFRFSGIFRSVHLTTYHGAYIKDVCVKQALNDDYSKGAVSIKIKSSGELGEKNIVISCLGRTDLGNVINSYPKSWEKTEEKIVVSKPATISQGDNEFTFDIENPLLWSAETPNLYELKIGNVSQVFGFRSFKIDNGIMLLNGKRIVFKGVNRHEFSGVSGRVPNLEELWQDIVTIKKHNINAIRTCHYPNNSPIYELCDRVGLYMIDETDLETHGNWLKAKYVLNDLDYAIPGNRPEWKEMVLNRARRMYERDKNHPSILMWSCGNESFGGKNIKAMGDYFRSVDDSRVVHYEGVFNDRREDISDVESQMYTPVEGIKEFLAKDRSKPFICCEYTHAMGNSCGGMHKYTDLTETDMSYQGGFIWDYIDQSINSVDKFGVKYQKYGGDFDDRPSDYQFSGNGIVYGGSRLPSPKMQEVKYNYQNFKLIPEIADGKVYLTIKNLSLFTDTAIFDTQICIELNGELVLKKVCNFSVLPGCEEKFAHIADFDFSAKTGEYVVTVSLLSKYEYVWAKPAHEVAFGQTVFVKEGTAWLPEVTQTDELKIIWGDNNIGVKGSNFTAMFGYRDVGMSSYTYKGVELFKAVPKPNFWRAPVDNDCGNSMQFRYSQWKLASLYQRIVKDNPDMACEFRTEDDHFLVKYIIEMATTPASKVELTYKVYGNGVVKVRLFYDPVKELGDMPEFGMLFKLDSDYDRLKWYGKGPSETYADRSRGGRIGLHESTADEQFAQYMVPQECGNHTEVRFAEVTNEAGNGIRFATTDSLINFSALPYSPHELENATHTNELPPKLYTNVKISLAQMGVGGDDSWGAKVHEEYLIDVTKPVEFEFGFVGI